MAVNFSGMSGMFERTDTHLEAKFVFDGKEYEVEHFGINFAQKVDCKGQPQHEMKGGKITIILTQSIGDNIYDWAKRENKTKDGKILFRPRTQGTVLEIVFSNAYCIKLTGNINTYTGTKTTLVIAPQKVSLNGVPHDNHWKE
jgi:hypothetical protein